MVHSEDRPIRMLALYEMFVDLPEYIKKLNLSKYMDSKDFSLEVDYSWKT
jgi:hypothetical protein